MSNEIPEGWQQSRLGDLADIRFSNVDKKSHEDEQPVKLCNYTDVYYNSRITNRIPFMHATAKEREVEKFSLQQGDVIITKDSETPDDIAVPSFVSEPLENVLCGYHLTLLRPYEGKASGEYLGHLFNLPSVQHHFYVLANGITRFGLTSDAVTEAPVVHPPLPEQKKIAAILTSVDEAIEKQEAQIAKLQDLKKAMMQELLTQGIGHTEFKDSPVGRIPVGWGVKPLASSDISVLDGDRGKEYPKEKDFMSSGYCLFLSAKNVTKRGFRFRECAFISNEKDSKLRKGRLNRGDIVITTRGTVGNMAYFDESVPYDVIRINSGMAILRNESTSIDTIYFYQLLNSPLVNQQLELLTFGSAQPQLTIGVINSLSIPLPPKNEQQKIAYILISMDDNIEAKQKKLAHSKSLKKALMQDLLTGKVRVKV